MPGAVDALIDILQWIGINIDEGKQLFPTTCSVSCFL
jgi:hypothetical protein